MFAPNGPLPSAVYWRRRAFAAGSSLLAVVTLAWVIGGLVGNADEHPVRGESHDRAMPSSPPKPSPPGPGHSATTSVGSAPGVASTTVPPSPPKACPDSVVTVTARTGASRYRVGERPVLRLLVMNAGPVPCTRDLNRGSRELVILSADGRRRLWSSNDCYAPPSPDRRLLAPGKPVEFQLRWAGRTSAPGCPVERRTVPAGEYRVVGKLGRLAGEPSPLVLTR
jgi:hypothetical protein